MRIRHIVFAAATALAMVLGAGAAAAATDAGVKSPVQVKQALGTLNRVVDHTGRLISAKNYGQLPHENEEFKEGSVALDKALASDDAMKQKVDPLLSKANASSADIAAAANAHDDKKLASAHADFEKSVKAILAAFPKDVQPPPPTVAQEKAEEKAR